MLACKHVFYEHLVLARWLPFLNEVLLAYKHIQAKNAMNMYLCAWDDRN